VCAPGAAAGLGAKATANGAKGTVNADGHSPLGSLGPATGSRDHCGCHRKWTANRRNPPGSRS
jgi:hypothetical protein